MALTVGIGTIMDAREVAIIATGPGKAKAVKMGVEGGVSHLWTISALQMHPSWLLVVDEDACQELTLEIVNVSPLLNFLGVGCVEMLADKSIL